MDSDKSTPLQKETPTQNESAAIQTIREQVASGNHSPEFQKFTEALQKALSVPKQSEELKR